MQKLNAREVYVLTILIIATAILVYLMADDIFSNISSIRKDGGMVSISAMDLRSHTKSLLQIVLNVSAIVLFWRIKRLGWVFSFAILLFYCFIISYVMFYFGYVDVASTVVGLGGIFFFLLGLIFLIIPSTIRKYKVNKFSSIPLLITIGALCLLYFGII